MADTYVPTAGIHIEDLPTTDTAESTDGLIINSNNNTVNQISLGDLLKETDAKIQANTDLIDSSLKDYVLWTYNQAEDSVTINGNVSYNCTNSTSIPSTPSGYKRLTYMSGGSGAACVCPSGFGSTYVYNASSSAVTYTPRIYALFVRNI